MKYTVEAKDSNVHYFSFSTSTNHTLPTLFCSDLHIDSIHCKREELKKDFNIIREQGGKIFIFGDVFDVMGSFGDKRLQREYIDPQFIQSGRTYLDLIVEFGIEFLRPYAQNIAFISQGNHETAMRKFHNTDILRRIVYELNREPDTNIQLGDYSGWLNLKFNVSKTHSNSINVHYHHGFGGNAARSKGMLGVQIEAFKYPDANILVRGHTHQKWYDPSTTRVRLNSRGKVYKDKIRFIQSGSYVDGVADGKGGWVVEKNFNPTDIGGWFVNFTPKLSGGDVKIEVGVHETIHDTF